MQPNTDELLERAIAALSGLIELAKSHGLGNSVLFLEMARLQLQLDFHGITDEEFGALCDALENGTLPAATVPRVPAAHARPRRDGSQRAWQCPDEIVVPRRRRRASQ